MTPSHDVATREAHTPFDENRKDDDVVVVNR